MKRREARRRLQAGAEKKFLCRVQIQPAATCVAELSIVKPAPRLQRLLCIKAVATIGCGSPRGADWRRKASELPVRGT
jgi:hypothetical protein